MDMTPFLWSVLLAGGSGSLGGRARRLGVGALEGVGDAGTELQVVLLAQVHAVHLLRGSAAWRWAGQNSPRSRAAVISSRTTRQSRAYSSSAGVGAGRAAGVSVARPSRSS